MRLRIGILVVTMLIIVTCLSSRNTLCVGLNVVAHATILYLDPNGSVVSKSIYRIPENLAISFEVTSKVHSVLIIVDSLAPYEVAYVISPSGINIVEMKNSDSPVIFTRKYVLFYPYEIGTYRIVFKRGVSLDPIHAIIIGDIIKEESRTLKPYGKITIAPEVEEKKLYALKVDLVVMGKRPRSLIVDEHHSVLAFNTIPAMGDVLIMNMSILIFSSKFSIINSGEDNILLMVKVRPITISVVQTEWYRDRVVLKVPRGAWLRILTPPHLIFLNNELEYFDPIINRNVNGGMLLSIKPRAEEYTMTLKVMPRFERVTFRISLPYANDFISYLYFPYGVIVESNNTVNLVKPTMPYLNISVLWRGIEVDRLFITSLEASEMEISCKGRKLRIEIVDCKGDPINEAMVRVYALELNEYLFECSGRSVLLFESLPPIRLLVSVEYMGEEVCREIIDYDEVFKILRCNVTSFRILIRDLEGEELPELKLILFKNKNIVGNYTTDNNGMALIRQIPIGDYYLKVFNRLTGQCLYEGTIYVSMDLDVYEISIDVKSLTIRVKDILRNPLEGINVKITGENIDLELSLGKNGEIVLDKLKHGVYTIEILGHSVIVSLDRDRIVPIYLGDIIFISGIPINVYLLSVIVLLPLLAIMVRIIFKWRETIIIR